MAAGGDLGEHLPLGVLALLADVEGAHRAEVAHDARPHLALDRLGLGMELGALVAGEVLSHEVAVDRADGEGRRDGDVRRAEGGQGAAHELLAGGGRGDALVHVQVQDGAAGVLGLELLLHLLGLEGVVGVAHGDLGGVRVVGVGLRSGLEDAGVALAVLLGEAVGGALGRGGLEVVEVAGGLLELDHLVAHVVQEAHAHGVAARVGQVVGVVGEVADHLVHAVDAQGGEVVVQGAQVPLGEGEQAGVDVVLDDGALELEGVAADLQQPVDVGQVGHAARGKDRHADSLRQPLGGLDVDAAQHAVTADVGVDDAEINNILQTIKSIKINESKVIGQYRNIDLEVSYKFFTNEHNFTFKGATNHSGELGVRADGNITRLDNAIHKIPERLN